MSYGLREENASQQSSTMFRLISGETRLVWSIAYKVPRKIFLSPSSSKLRAILNGEHLHLTLRNPTAKCFIVHGNAFPYCLVAKPKFRYAQPAIRNFANLSRKGGELTWTEINCRYLLYLSPTNSYTHVNPENRTSQMFVFPYYVWKIHHAALRCLALNRNLFIKRFLNVTHLLELIHQTYIQRILIHRILI